MKTEEHDTPLLPPHTSWVLQWPQPTWTGFKQLRTGWDVSNCPYTSEVSHQARRASVVQSTPQTMSLITVLCVNRLSCLMADWSEGRRLDNYTQK